MAEGELLNFVQKRFLVQQLAEYATPTQAAKAFKEEFGFEVKPNRVAFYNPTTKSGAALAPDLKALFHEHRKASLEKLDGIRIFHKANQLRALDRALTVAEGRGQIAMVIPLVEAAAKISGTTAAEKHQHEHSAPGGVPLTAAIFLTGAPAGASTPETVVRVPQPGD